MMSATPFGPAMQLEQQRAGVESLRGELLGGLQQAQAEVQQAQQALQGTAATWAKVSWVLRARLTPKGVFSVHSVGLMLHKGLPASDLLQTRRISSGSSTWAPVLGVLRRRWQAGARK